MSFTPQLSVILPTLRFNQAKDAIPTILASCQGIDAELIVVCDEKTEAELYPTIPPHCAPPVIFLNREQHDGPIAAIHQGYQHSAGDYVFVMGDEDRMVGSLAALHAIAEADRLKGDTHVIYCPWEGGAAWAYWGRPFPPFPFVHRDVIDGPLKGVFFDPAYGSHYSDPDLGQRAADAGIRIDYRNDCRLSHNQDNDGLHMQNVTRDFQRDEDLFRQRWGHLGGWPSLSM